MEFFDKALNKAKETLDVVSKKTGEVVNTEKQKFDVSSLKSKREKDFAELGKIYFEKIANEEISCEKTAALVASIKEKNEKIDALNAEILSAKNKRICPKCGAGIDVNAVFCSSCGSKLDCDNEE